MQGYGPYGGGGQSSGSLFGPGFQQSQGAADAIARYSALSGMPPVVGGSNAGFSQGGAYAGGGMLGWSGASAAVQHSLFRMGAAPATASMVPAAGLGSSLRLVSASGPMATASASAPTPTPTSGTGVS